MRVPLSWLADHVDLDSHLMLRNAPYTGLGLDGGRIVQADGPGLGVVATDDPDDTDDTDDTDDPGG